MASMDEPIPLGANEALLRALEERLSNQPFWRERTRACFEKSSPHALHLAILHEPYLGLILAGRKTIESRFSVNRIAPYQVAQRDDLVLLKRSSGPVKGLCLLADPVYYNLDAASWREIPRRFAAQICPRGPDFWAARRRARYASLLPIKAVLEIPTLNLKKSDRRGWVVVTSRDTDAGQLPFGVAEAAAGSQGQ
jgi:hypothetical protein